MKKPCHLEQTQGPRTEPRGNSNIYRSNRMRNQRRQEGRSKHRRTGSHRSLKAYRFPNFLNRNLSTNIKNINRHVYCGVNICPFKYILSINYQKENSTIFMPCAKALLLAMVPKHFIPRTPLCCQKFWRTSRAFIYVDFQYLIYLKLKTF